MDRDEGHVEDGDEYEDEAGDADGFYDALEVFYRNHKPCNKAVFLYASF